MSANNFQEDLRWSEVQHLAGWWEPYYRKAFPRLSSIQAVPGPSAAQRAGVDKFVILAGGKRIAVDEKVRRNRKPDDILLEFEHVPVDGGASWSGWIEKDNQFTDYVAVGFHAYRVAFFLPFQNLQSAWMANKAEWVKTFGVVKAPNPRDNPRYFTHSCAVRTDLLLGNLLCAMRMQL